MTAPNVAATQHQFIPFDVRQPSALPPNQASKLANVFESTSRQWATILTQRLRTAATIALKETIVQPYEDYISTLPPHTVMSICAIEGPHRTDGKLDPSILLQIPVPLVMQWIDYTLGGTDRVRGHVEEEFEKHELTEIEEGIYGDYVENFLGALHYSLTGIVDASFAQRSIQYAPQFVQSLAAGDSVFVSTFRVKLPHSEQEISLMIPADFIMSALRESEAHTEPTPAQLLEAAERRKEMRKAMSPVPLSVTVGFEPQGLPVAAVRSLTPGSLITLNHLATVPLQVHAEGRLIAHAQMNDMSGYPRQDGLRGQRTSVTIAEIN